MAIDALGPGPGTWKTTLAALPKVANDSWADNFAAWYAGRLTGIEPDSAALVPVGFVFTFPESTFADGLRALGPSEDALAAIEDFAAAWRTAIEEMVYPTSLAVDVGTTVAPFSPAPNTTFSEITSVVIDSDSIDAAVEKIVELATASPVADPFDSEFPVKFREATLLLTITVTGKDSQPPPSAGPGPQDLEAAAVPLL